MKKILALMAIILLISAPVLAQEIDYCEGDFDGDGDCDGTDAAVLKDDFGRSPFKDPCPPPNPAPSLIPKTGQTTSFAIGDDGDLQRGVAWPNPRFTDNSDGTISDNLTGLIWLKDANCFGRITWSNALSDSNGLENGECGLTDNSSPGDWRLPNHRELFSLIDVENHDPALPSGHPFTNVVHYYYWTSTATAFSTVRAWAVSTSGVVTSHYKSDTASYVWPVRGGQ